LTQEELDHIAYIQRIAEQEQLSVLPVPTIVREEVTTADSVTPTATPVTEAPVDAPVPLTQEELDHIAYIQRLADQEQLSILQKPPVSTTAVEDLATSVPPAPESPVQAPMELTQEELDHIASIQRMAEQEHLSLLQKPVSTIVGEEDKVTVTHPDIPAAVPLAEALTATSVELTREELDHIAYIQRMAEQEQMPAQQLPVSVTAKAAEQPSPSRATFVSEPPAEALAQLTQEELDHIAYVQSMAEQEQVPAQKLSDLLTSKDETAAHDIVKAAPLAEPHAEAVQLTQEELDHIAYIQRMAEQEMLALQEPSVAVRPQEKTAEAHDFSTTASPAKQPTEAQLTQEELDHIAYIQKLAEESFGMPTTEEFTLRIDEHRTQPTVTIEKTIERAPTVESTLQVWNDRGHVQESVAAVIKIDETVSEPSSVTMRDQSEAKLPSKVAFVKESPFEAEVQPASSIAEAIDEHVGLVE
ncbi:unnamed protein product, partial [Cylicostephanus goldi]